MSGSWVGRPSWMTALVWCGSAAPARVSGPLAGLLAGVVAEVFAGVAEEVSLTRSSCHAAYRRETEVGLRSRSLDLPVGSSSGTPIRFRDGLHALSLRS